MKDVAKFVIIPDSLLQFRDSTRFGRAVAKRAESCCVQIEQRPDLLRPAVELLQRWTWVSGKGLAKEVGKAALDERLMKKIEVTDVVGKNRASVRTVWEKMPSSRYVHVLFTFSVARPTTHNLAPPPLEKGGNQAYLMCCNSSTQELATSILASRVYCSTNLIRPPSR